MKKVAVVLSGCGARDGSEIREALFLMLALAKHNIKYECFAPNIDQFMVYNHYKDEVSEGEKRNVLTESARLARGRVKDLATLNEAEFDGLAFAGGYGASFNLCDFGVVKSFDFTIDKDVERCIIAFKKNNKGMIFLCISSVIAAKLIPDVHITLGSEVKEVSDLIRQNNVTVTDLDKNIPIIDSGNKIVTTPCYLVNATIVELYEGIEKGVKEFTALL